MPGGSSPATATLITSLPYSDTDVTPAPPDGLWWKYVGAFIDIAVGVFGPSSTVKTRLTVYAADGVTPYLPSTFYPTGTFNTIVLFNTPIEVPLSEGTVIYFKVFSPVTPDTFTLSVLPAPNLTAPTGSICVPDDTSPFPAALLSATDGTVQQFRALVAAGERSDVLPTGVSLSQDVVAGLMVLYDTDFTELASLSYGAAGTDLPISTNRVDTFYVGQPGSPATVTTIDAAGNFGPTTWHISSGNGTIQSLAPSLDETILYYVETHLVGAGTIRRWDLTNDTALSDLAAGQANNFTTPDLFVLLDDTILAMYQRSALANAPKAIHYATDGTVLNTYTFTGYRSNDARLATALDDPVSFWAWTKLLPTAATPTRFWNVRVSDGASLATIDAQEFERGHWNNASTTTPAVRFAHSHSCAFFIIRASVPPNLYAPPITGTIDVTLPLSGDVALDAALTGYRLPPRHIESLCRTLMTIAALMPDARQRMFNALGTVLAGSKLQSYEAGSTTPLPTYSDSGLTVPNSNPQIADSGGLLGPIYLLAQAYKFVLFDANNLQIWSQDNVWDSGELLGATVAALQTEVTANLALTQTKFCTTAFSQANSATLANIIGLTGFTLTAGGVYKFDINLAGTAGASGGVKYAFKYTTATLTNLEASGIGTTVSAVACQNATSTTDQATLYGQTAAVLNTRITGRITVNVGGTLAVQAAQNASDGTATTVAVGSWATFTKVS